ncbi:MAG: ExeM/NucH family extracellular endonuclease [Bryobacteraceae bacterium]|nr:ExeM/NucH family extracellular endonuclease [Bryobacteraceae bacterium]
MKHLATVRMLACAALAVCTAFGQAKIVISQVYGGGGSSSTTAPLSTYQRDYIELFNAGDAAQSINGWTLKYASASGTSWTKITLPNVSIQPGKYHLVVTGTAGSTGTVLTGDTDGGGSINASATDGKIALFSGDPTITAACPTNAALVDFVGFGTANCAETTATAAMARNTAALRKSNGCTDTGNNSADFNVTTPNPRTSALTAAPCSGGGGSTNPVISGTANPSTVAPGGNTTLSGTLTAGTVPTSASFTVACNLTTVGGSNPTSATVNGTSWTLAVTVTANTTTGSKTIACTVTDDQSRTGSVNITLGVAAPTGGVCGDSKTQISTIQGSGATSPVTGQTVTIEGIVVGDFQGASGLNGFYVQDEGDGNPATSDGIFIDESTTALGAVSVGQRVRLTGVVAETFSQTVLNGTSGLSVCSTGNTVTPVDINFPVSSTTFLEQYEGMVVRFPQQLRVSDNYNLGRFNEVGLAFPSNGDRLYTSTQVALPGAPQAAVVTANNLRKIILDDSSNLTYNSIATSATYPTDGGGLAANNTLRLGDRVNVDAQGAYTPLVGVLGYGFSAYRLFPTQAVTFGPSDNPRPTTPPVVGGRAKVAFANVLNYFTTFTSVDSNARGADSQAEFDRQRAKIINAINGLDASVVGISELENNASTAIANLVSGLNTGNPGKWNYINTGVVGTDAIRNAIIYQPALVTPTGTWAVLDSSVDSRALTGRNRPSIAQTFRLNAGPKPNLQHFTVVVNHFKSKGSACTSSPSDPNLNDGQDDCNLTRISIAQALIDWLATNPTSDPTPAAQRRILLMGDLNAYLREDPIRALTDPAFSKPAQAGFSAFPAKSGATFRNIIEKLYGEFSYSYMFSGTSGSLDHALANPNLFREIAGAADWHINADEPCVLDYNGDFNCNGSQGTAAKSASQLSAWYSSDPFRTSDHDPVLIGFNPLCGDLDDDGDVDAADQAILRNAMFKTPVNRRHDFNGDGIVNTTDLGLWTACSIQAR